MEMKILVEEEYGYRYWVWTPMSDVFDIVLEEFKSTTGAERYYCTSPKMDFDGYWEEVSFDEWGSMYDRGEYDAYAHIHETNDSNIIERKEMYTQ